MSLHTKRDIGLRSIVALALVLAPILILVGAQAGSKQASQPRRPEVRLEIAAVNPRPPERLRPDLALYEPEKGCYLGAYIDLADELSQTYVDATNKSRKVPTEFEAIVGKRHAIYFFYLGYGQPLPMDWLRKLTVDKKFVHIALEPNLGLDQVLDDEYLQTFADELRNSGARVFLRFASEMNGPWVRYSGDPELYKEKWRMLTQVMRERAPNVAMVWCPYVFPASTIDAYYPGDDYVDWVGVNFYSVTYFDQNQESPAFHWKPSDFLTNIYNKYSDRKPIMIGEYATTHFSALEDKNHAAFAIHNIQTLYGELERKFPRVKAINYFNTNNLKLEHRQNNNYSVTHDLQVLAAYREAIQSPYFLSAPPDGQASGPGFEIESLEENSVLKGRTRLLLWAHPREFIDSLTLSINGQPVANLTDLKKWQTVLQCDELPKGPAKLKLEAKNRSGQVIQTKEIPVTIEHSTD